MSSTIYVETSALLAILLEEPDAPELLTRLRQADRRVTSVVSSIEAGIALGRNVGDIDFATGILRLFVKEAGIEVQSVPADFYGDAMRAAARYGKGTGHAARLNFGDCFSYAFSKRGGFPILFKGEDFSKTDLVAA